MPVFINSAQDVEGRENCRNLDEDARLCDVHSGADTSSKPKYPLSRITLSFPRRIIKPVGIESERIWINEFIMQDRPGQ